MNPATGNLLDPPEAGLIARLRHRFHVDDRATSSLKAAFVFLIRVVSAGLLILTQILLARWMGAYAYGVYVFAWTLVIIVGDLLPLGFSYTAQRLIPQYRQSGDVAALRGFLRIGPAIVVGIATIFAAVSLMAIAMLGDAMPGVDPLVISIAVCALPAYALGSILEGVARAFDRVSLAMMPTYILRPILLVSLVAIFHFIGFESTAAEAMTAAVLATWLSVTVQAGFVFMRGARITEKGPSDLRVGEWFAVSLRFFTAWSFITLYTYADVVMLNAFSTSDKVGIYFASAKILALTSFVGYAVASVFAHRFVDRNIAGDHEGLRRAVSLSVNLTFWPSLALTGGVLLISKPLLSLFGPEFVAGPEILAVLSFGLLARASIGPAERLLSMLGHQGATAGVYAAAFAMAVVMSFLLVPRFDMLGAALASCAAMMTEATLLWILVRRRLKLNVFAFSPTVFSPSTFMKPRTGDPKP